MDESTIYSETTLKQYLQIIDEKLEHLTRDVIFIRNHMIEKERIEKEKNADLNFS